MEILKIKSIIWKTGKKIAPVSLRNQFISKDYSPVLKSRNQEQISTEQVV